MAIKSNIKVKIGESYTFESLEKFLFQYENENKFLKLYDPTNKQKAIMHVFFQNFCGNWRSGDGVLFYDDGETHSADSGDLFEVLEIMSI